MKRKKQVPDYEIVETIGTIENPEIEIINKARRDFMELIKDKISETGLQNLKERRI